MSGTISVSYLVIGSYIAFVVGSSLLVGLLPPLVNRPTCKEDKVLLKSNPIIDKRSLIDTVVIETNENVKMAESNFHDGIDYNKLKEFSKRLPHRNTSLESKIKNKLNRHATVRLDLNQRIESFNKMYPSEARSFHARRKAEVKSGYPICTEILDSSVNGPWKNNRLPGDVVPSNYILDILVPRWGLEVYDGSVDINVNVLKPTQYFLLHSKLDIPLLKVKTFKNVHDCIYF